MKRIVIAGATLLLCANALADECANATTQADINACAITQYQTADKKLNDTYQHALKRAAPAQQALLKRRKPRGLRCGTPTAR